MRIEQNIPLAPLTTLGIGGPARFYLRAATCADVLGGFAFARARGLPVFVLGGGSNLVVPDAGYDGLVLHIALTPAIEVAAEGVVEVSAGTEWDTLVRFACERGWAGLECLAGIPGLVGGAPIQNIGAYGQEASQTIVEVAALDRAHLGEPVAVRLPVAECGFSYRTSLFNTAARGRYVVTAVRFQLHPGGPPQLAYADLAPLRPAAPTLLEVFGFVRATRARKGMWIDPAHPGPDTRSAGSFFKNPVVPAEAVTRIAAALGLPASEVKHWPAGEGKVKLPAAWLIECAGFPRGFAETPESSVAISTRHTLALVNRSGDATCAELFALRDRIRGTVAERFGVELEQEPVVLT